MNKTSFKALLVALMLVMALSCALPSPPSIGNGSASGTSPDDFCTCPEMDALRQQVNASMPCPDVPSDEVERLLPTQRFFYILVDNSLSYSDRDAALTWLRDGIAQGIHPGDEIIIALVGERSIEDITHLVVPSTQITVVATPTPVALSEFMKCQIPTPTAIPVSTTLQEIEHDQAVERAEACNRQLEQQKEELSQDLRQCADYQWYQQQSRILQDVIGEIEKAIDAIKAQEPESSTELYGALFAASEVFAHKNIWEYDDVVLLIFTDGRALDTPQSRDYDFSGVNVIMAVLPYDNDYSQIETKWREWFQLHNAKSFDVTPYFLSDEIINLFIP